MLIFCKKSLTIKAILRMLEEIMNLIKIAKLIFEYAKYGEDGSVVGASRAIDNVSIDIEKGSFVAVLGHNGSGKSTLAKHLNAILLPTEGTVWIGEDDTKNSDALWDIRQRAGMVFQNPDNQIIANVVEEDVAFGPENIGVPTREIWRRVDESLKAVGMTAFRKKSPNKLSGGQKQKIAIARALLKQKEIIFIDEGTSNLDNLSAYEIEKIILDSKAMIISITHHLKKELLEKYDEILVLDQGKIIESGSYNELIANQQLFYQLLCKQ